MDLDATLPRALGPPVQPHGLDQEIARLATILQENDNESWFIRLLQTKGQWQVLRDRFSAEAAAGTIHTQGFNNLTSFPEWASCTLTQNQLTSVLELLYQGHWDNFLNTKDKARLSRYTAELSLPSARHILFFFGPRVARSRVLRALMTFFNKHKRISTYPIDFLTLYRLVVRAWASTSHNAYPSRLVNPDEQLRPSHVLGGQNALYPRYLRMYLARLSF